jgi:hypothetical protein
VPRDRDADLRPHHDDPAALPGRDRDADLPAAHAPAAVPAAAHAAADLPAGHDPAGLPAADVAARPAELAACESVRLFCERAAAVAPAFAGITLAVPTLGLPFVLAGTLKIVYDLAIFAVFRGVRPPEESARAGAVAAATNR